MKTLKDYHAVRHIQPGNTPIEDLAQQRAWYLLALLGGAYLTFISWLLFEIIGALK